MLRNALVASSIAEGGVSGRFDHLNAAILPIAETQSGEILDILFESLPRPPAQIGIRVVHPLGEMTPAVWKRRVSGLKSIKGPALLQRTFVLSKLAACRRPSR